MHLPDTLLLLIPQTTQKGKQAFTSDGDTLLPSREHRLLSTIFQASDQQQALELDPLPQSPDVQMLG